MRVNFQRCISGQYTSLCNHSLLTSDETVQVAGAERRVNFQRCISGQYPSLCKHSLLTPDEAARVADAERRAGNRCFVPCRFARPEAPDSHTSEGALYSTDEWQASSTLKLRSEHVMIRKEKGRPVGRDHISGIEGFWSYTNELTVSVPRRAPAILPSVPGGSLLSLQPPGRRLQTAAF